LSRSAVVLIDEIELHLHPQWQREVLPALQKTFPNIQFIVTTHSPQVLSRVHKDDIFILDSNKVYKPSSNPIGRSSSDILEEVMFVTKRPKEIQELSDKYFLLINKNLFNEANDVRELLLNDYKLDKQDPIFSRADAMIARKHLLKK
jgi:predicted ATP-binding protein involved in virulence